VRIFHTVVGPTLEPLVIHNIINAILLRYLFIDRASRYFVRLLVLK
jgi:hypothetical protein